VPLTVHRTSIAGVVVVENTIFSDHRGSFGRLFCATELSPVLGERRIVQINLSRTDAVGSVRGLHYQLPPSSEVRFVRCLRGAIWDVAVDLRANSASFLQWHAEELTAENRRMVVVPEGCGHGFQVLEAGSEVLYLHTVGYVPELEAGVRFDSARLAINWPLPAADLSARDQSLPEVTQGFEGVSL
jgi:dTDP-4-dehydrorhamnose 3,5-epimerase